MSPELDDWIVAEYAGGADVADLARRTGLAPEQVLAVITHATAGPAPGVQERDEQIVAAYAEFHDPEQIARQTGLTTGEVYDVVHRSVGVPAPYRVEPWVIVLVVAAVLAVLTAMATAVWVFVSAGGGLS
jgi:hypothetical protein